jgi:transcriptional regulator with AAA-type ATPase domain
MPEDVRTRETVEDGDGATDARPAELRVPHLFLVLECARPTAGGARHDLANIDEVVLGRGKVRTASRSVVSGRRTLTVRVPDSRMSQNHARLVRARGGFVVEDLGSRNGSRLNGNALHACVALADGDALECGHTLFRFRAALRTPLATVGDFDSGNVAGSSLSGATLLPDLARRHDAVAKIAPSKIPVLLLGETGTGKEVLAHAIHDASGRPGSFVAVNCGAIPSTLIESQLFGHVRGAFSGAARDEPGFIRSAHGGTLFLDEIGDLPLSCQAALLRTLQEEEVVPVGSARPIRVNVRIVSATHRDLRERVARGDFRADLFARIAGLAHTLPPLRERLEDLGVVLASLVARLPSEATPVTLSPAAGRKLLAYPWPLNIRELQQRLAVAAVLASGAPIGVEHLDHEGAMSAVTETSTEDRDLADRRREENLRALLLTELARSHGNVAEVARSMGKARMQVQRWLKRFAIDPAAFRAS